MKPTVDIIPIKELITQQLVIPSYQRPYKWTITNVNDLINDIIFFSKDPTYRLGTVIVYKEKDESLEVMEVVDGQQRLLTLTLLILAINEKIEEELGYPIMIPIAEQDFKNHITRQQLQVNYRHIKTRVSEFSPKITRFLLNDCKVVQVKIFSINEAFQFFDSQNSRGKALYPHNLLKAFHLREMETETDKEKIEAVSLWDATESYKLQRLFSIYLFRLRNWIVSQPAYYFSGNDIDTFKGVTLSKEHNYPYTFAKRINDVFVKEYNLSISRKIDNSVVVFPQQLDDVITNGQRFFEYTQTYKDLLQQLTDYKSETYTVIINTVEEKDILDYIVSGKGTHRTGDGYCKELFECALLFYTSKFGIEHLPQVFNKLFLWAFRLRLGLRAVRIESVNNHAVHPNSLIKLIARAKHPKEIVAYQVKPVALNFDNVHGLDVIFNNQNTLINA
ncbi:MAG: DUF262 domain-containing protein [Patiriisocius sp.]|uniref:DUF262 domain-containing protein n=1 Tax=Patiriisocius sp. TaxID=2822396 RepID=UPI003EF5E4E3